MRPHLLLRRDYYGVLVQDKAKKDFLLSALVPHNPLLVDNLMSNAQLTYEDAKNHLCTLPSSQLKEGFSVIYTNE